MKLRWSALSILVTLIATTFAISSLAPQSRIALPGLGTAAPSPVDAGQGRAASAEEGTAARGALRPHNTLPPTATPLPTATPTARPTATPTATPTAMPVLSRAIFVDQDAQVMHIYENGIEVRSMPCSTGLPVPAKRTPARTGVVGAYVGTFFAFGTYQDEGWRLFEDFLIHSAPYLVEDGVKVYQEVEALGQRPVSHGCIRLSPEDALWLTEWNPKGVPFTISPLTREFAP